MTKLQHIPYIANYLANYFVQRKNFSFFADLISRKIIDFNETLDLDFSFKNKKQDNDVTSVTQRKENISEKSDIVK